MPHCASKKSTASTTTPSRSLQVTIFLTSTPRTLLSILCTILVLNSWTSLTPVACQRPLLNHTSYNSIAAAQQHNYLGSGKQLRNGRTRDMPIPQATMSSLTQRGMLPYDDFDGPDGARAPPSLGGRGGGRGETSRRRLNLSGLGASVGRPNSGRGGIDSLRKELMKPSVGGPGGGISGTNVGYPSYSATSSIGKIDGLGSLGPADRYGDQLRPGVETQYPAHYQTPFVVNQADPTDAKPFRVSPKKSYNSISEIRKLNKQRFPPQGQADEPEGGVTNGNIDGHDGDVEEHRDPLEVIKEKMRNTAPKSSPYETQTDSTPSSEIEDQLGVKCTFENACAWKWAEGLHDGFQVISGMELVKKNMTGLYPGPIADATEDGNGHFLYARLLPTTEQVNLTSPQFSTTMEKCYLEVYMHQSDMSHGLSRVVVEPMDSQESSWVPAEIVGDNYRQWGRKFYRLGRISRDFRIVFEIVPKLGESQKAHVAIDNLHMVNCFPEGTKSEKCSTSQIKCMMNKVPVCIPLPRICDITKDCDDGEDELLNCDKIPYGGRCDFEQDWCGWRDSGKTMLTWSRHTGASPTHDTGPDGDHTQQHLLNATGGYYMLVNMNQHMNNSDKASQVGFASNAFMISKTFNPPPLVHGNPNSPYRNSCVVRFYIHQFGKNPGSINLSVVEMKEKENITTTLWWSSKNQGSDWLRAEYILPNITSKYFLHFEARKGMRIFSDVAVDDISLSPECFGLNIPKEHLNGYNYWDVRHNFRSPSHKDYEHKHYLELTTCDTRGMIGPTQLECEVAYNENNQSHVLNEVQVIEEESNYRGMQKWKVPHEGYYTIIAKGASGGLGSGGVGSSRGAMAVSVLELHKNEELYILVGQQGENACIKSLSAGREEGCGADGEELDLSKYSFSSKQHMVKNIYIENGAGGGGGGSFVFLLNSAKNEAVPLLIAGGGGGLGIGQYIDEDFQHGQKPNPNRFGVTGQIHGDQMNLKTAGPGGGWRAKSDQRLSLKYGAALLQGGYGGHSCYTEGLGNNNVSTVTKHGQGGFGGGGGGCNTGGGGGGYAGGDVYLNESNGEGGTSFISVSRSLKEFSIVYEGASSGSGSVIIIPAIEGCGCDYRCIALDEYRSSVRCICPDGWRLKKDNQTACEVLAEESSSYSYLIGFFIFLVVLLGAALTALIVILYNRYQRKKQAKLRHKMLLEQDLQLSRLRHNIDDSNLTNFNPNYGCDGILNGRVDVKQLPQIARESLRLVKALGQGAFGEVYQGFYRARDNDTVEMPVAVKTLPEMSTRQAEEDFLMEAAIMSKFNHPNMVHLLGVCFDRHPRFIVLELLAGGDLKNFLREGRSKPDRPSQLIMKDLLLCAEDVARGCEYMESKRFIHRDIAARNCLLSSRGPGRVVKIADFGMARDIYRSDYYRKGGKAMLPIKWMPPEAYVDGIFSVKTDVWSFGVLLWEVFSLGMMPYPGLQNPQVMKLVANGGRLGSPPACPPAIYRIMADCWNPTPEHRPNFHSLLNRIHEVTLDEELMMSSIPESIFHPLTANGDQVVLHPPGGEEFCLPIPQTSDYLIPLPSGAAVGLIANMDYASATEGSYDSTGAVATISTACSANICTPPAVASPNAPNVEFNIDGAAAAAMGDSDCWETSFILPNSKSDQPLLSGAVGGVGTTNANDSQRSIHDAVLNGVAAAGNLTNGHNSSSQHSPVLHNGMNGIKMNQLNHNNNNNNNNNNHHHHHQQEHPHADQHVVHEMEEAKLISLDTPQPTPTTIQPPLSFCSQLDGITLDPATLTKSLQQHKVGAGGIMNSAATSSYANVQMMPSSVNATHQLIGADVAMKELPLPNGGAGVGGVEKINGMIDATLPNGPSGVLNGVATVNGNGVAAAAVNADTAAPFTIQGYNDRYKDKHAEISC
ncbi:tyrosine-protein kinase receptor [Bactrocera dorsalis]|uniref:Tyrosine-protein kinase receptor n=1 Tax=Bactrocera dorsalis TaxID=27457 RepID=A0A6I9V5M7_BACDO|nr:tyrosine-protein kinase receptor [Bactrocera dorsalis]XP_019846027.2 tyrosine-protein kinase receptor [Bactrocera dorsalis]XP_049307631.1 tyrosine-protein kinase receptor [Bactrocera dorsalis]